MYEEAFNALFRAAPSKSQLRKHTEETFGSC